MNMARLSLQNKAFEDKSHSSMNTQGNGSTGRAGVFLNYVFPLFLSFYEQLSPSWKEPAKPFPTELQDNGAECPEVTPKVQTSSMSLNLHRLQGGEAPQLLNSMDLRSQTELNICCAPRSFVILNTHSFLNQALSCFLTDFMVIMKIILE